MRVQKLSGPHFPAYFLGISVQHRPMTPFYLVACFFCARKNGNLRLNKTATPLLCCVRFFSNCITGRRFRTPRRLILTVGPLYVSGNRIAQEHRTLSNGNLCLADAMAAPRNRDCQSACQKIELSISTTSTDQVNNNGQAGRRLGATVL